MLLFVHDDCTVHQHEVQVCTRLNASRPADFTKGERLGKDDALVTWTRPKCPPWMSAEEYEKIPETLTLRMVRYSLEAKGFRTQSITVIRRGKHPVTFHHDQGFEGLKGAREPALLFCPFMVSYGRGVLT